jgi:STE24 endopeptidase
MDDPKKYESIKYVVSISGFALDILILVYLLLHGSVYIRDFADSIASSQAAEVLVYILIVGLIFKVIELPLAFYSGYVIEHRFNLSRQTKD